jgi:hypothetical protein
MTIHEELAHAIVLLDRSVATDPAASKTAAAHVAGSARMSPALQLDVYREQFWLRHVKSLREDFPSVQALLGGETAFDRLAAAYLAAHPPDHFRLRDLSAKMPDFLSGTMPWADDPLLADCARLEWALLEAFDAAEAPPLDPSAVAAIREEDWPNARLVLHPSLRFLDLKFPVKDFREAVRAGETPARPEHAHSHYVAYRRNEQLFVEPVEPGALALLGALANGEALGSAGERAAAVDPATEEKIGVWFQRWVTLGWVSAIRVTSSAAPHPG